MVGGGRRIGQIGGRHIVVMGKLAEITKREQRKGNGNDF